MIELSLYRNRIGCFGRNFKKKGIFKKVHYQKYGNLTENRFYPPEVLQLIFKLALLISLLVCEAVPISTEVTGPTENIQNHPTICKPTPAQSSLYFENIHQSYRRIYTPEIYHKPFVLEDKNFLARYTYGNKSKNGIKIVHWNKGPSNLENKMDEIGSVVKKYHPHILGLSEANLFQHHDQHKVQLPDYNLYTCPTIDNNQLKVSRVVVFTHNSLVVKARPDLMHDQISSIWLEVGLPRKKKILICNTYREWGYLRQEDKSSRTLSEQLVRWKIFITQWERALSEDKEVVVTGDINIDSMKWMRDDLPSNDSTHKLKALTQILFERIIPHGVSQQVTVPTHSWPGQQDSCLDHLYTNQPDKLSEVTLHAHGSDHKLLHVVRYAESIKKNVRYIRKRCFKGFDTTGFKAAVKEIKWYEVYCLTDVNVAVHVLTEKLTAVLDRFAPVRTLQVRTNYAPWLSNTTKETMKLRDIAQESAASSQDPHLWEEFRILRNRATGLQRKDKKSWETGQLDHLGNTSAKLWRNLKGWLGWKNSGPPTKLFYQGRMVTSPQGLADTMNSFFIEKVKNLRANLPPCTSDPLSHLKMAMATRTSIFALKPVHPDTVVNVVKNLKNSKSTGLDNIDVRTLKIIVEDIAPALTHVINLSITSMVFPNVWKLAKLVPLLKKGDPLCPSNYRPVALLSVLSKVLEKVVFMQVVEYMESNALIHPSHHGSRARHSTCTAVIEMYDSWVNSIEDGNMAGVMMLDLSAAFDLVDHHLLLQKLELMGFDKPATVWMWSYLHARSQCVYVDGKLSDFKAVSVGVPQGSVLGALLYILFVNDLPEVVHGHPGPGHQGAVQPREVSFNTYCSECGSLCCYVDDSTFMYSSSDPDLLTEKLTRQYRSLAKYMGDNRLVINNDKTRLLVMGTRNKEEARKHVRIDTGTVVITPVETEKLLGINIHQSLKWHEHVMNSKKSLISMLNTRLSALKRVSVNGSFLTRLMVGNACFMSVIVYMIAVWGGTEKYVVKAVQVMQNRAARCITKLGWLTPTKTLLDQCNWLSIKQMIFYHTALQVWSVRSSKVPVYINSKLKPAITRRHTRSTVEGKLMEPVVEKSVTRSSFMVRSASTWNQIPPDIRNIEKLETFKGNLKTWIRKNINID